MPSLSTPPLDVPPSFVAGVTLLAMHLARHTSLDLPSASEVLAAAGCSRGAAYAARHRLIDALATLVRRPGRPSRTKPEPLPAGRRDAAQGVVLDYLLSHPGAASQGAHRRRYSDGFRLMILELAAEQADIPLPELAKAVRVPVGTLKDWLAGGRDAIEKGLDTPNAATYHERHTHSRIVDILRAHETWDGSFVDFCTHVQHHLRIPFSRRLIADLLQAEGRRIARRRPGRGDTAGEALRGQFKTFFAGAQAVADGTMVSVRVGEESFSFNIELVVDAHTAAWTGTAITPTEDAQALCDALDDAHATTGQHPEALLADNKPSNHTPDVRERLERHGIIPIRATPWRPENKAHCEGAYGLFKQRCPELVLDPTDPSSLARQLVEKVVVTFARTLNHRPRKARDGRSRVEQFQQDKPTDEERQAARKALQKRAHQQERARQRQHKELEPALREHLDQAFDELELEDPEARFRKAIGRFHSDAILAGLAIFRTKRDKGTLPDGVDARYLLGIVRNIAQEDEGYQLADAIWRERRMAGDSALQGLQRTRDDIEQDCESVELLLLRIVGHAIVADRRVDRAFWLRAAADLLLEEPLPSRTPLFRLAARRIHGTHALRHRERLAATRRLAAMALPITPQSST